MAARSDWSKMMQGSVPARRGSLDWVFWVYWVVASTAAVLIGLGAIYATIFLAKAVTTSADEDRIMGILIFPVLGIFLGLLQWVVLRRRIAKSAWWIPCTAGGIVAGVAVAGWLATTIGKVIGADWKWDAQPQILILYVFIGLLLSLVQMPVLWRHTRWAVFWPMLGMMGWLFLGIIMGRSIDRTSDIFALGAIPAAVSGFGLVWSTRGRGC